MAHIVIIGAGLMGSAVAWPLSDNGHTVSLVGTHLDGGIIEEAKSRGWHNTLRRQLPPRVTPLFVEEIDTVVDSADLIVSGVNSWGVDWIGETLSRALDRGRDIIAVTKGLRTTPDGTVNIFPDVVASCIPEPVREQSNFMAIGGPCIAGELAGRRPTCVMFGAKDKETAEGTARLFRTDCYHIWPTADLWSLELAVALKNAYVLGVGIANGMLEAAGGMDAAGAHMYNPAAATFAQGLYEMEQILTALGGNGSFAHSLPGAGDQYVTAMGGRTVRLGTLLGRGYSYSKARQEMAGETLESASIIESMSRLYPALKGDRTIRDGSLPLLETLIAAIVDDQQVTLPFDRYFASI
jgi:glycerol-3-phosphate dehydrogenase (NAD(P)+)